MAFKIFLLVGSVFCGVAAVVVGSFIPMLYNGELEIFDFMMLLGFAGIFGVIGVALLIAGIKRVIQQSKIKKYGVEKWGVVLDLYESGTYVNDRPECQADICVVHEDLTTTTHKDVVGFNWDLYAVGDYVKVKHYDKYADVLYTINGSEIPPRMREILDNIARNARKNAHWQPPLIGETDNIDLSAQSMGSSQPDEIVINGVTYIKKS